MRGNRRWVYECRGSDSPTWLRGDNEVLRSNSRGSSVLSRRREKEVKLSPHGMRQLCFPGLNAWLDTYNCLSRGNKIMIWPHKIFFSSHVYSLIFSLFYNPFFFTGYVFPSLSFILFFWYFLLSLSLSYELPRIITEFVSAIPLAISFFPQIEIYKTYHTKDNEIGTNTCCFSIIKSQSNVLFRKFNFSSLVHTQLGGSLKCFATGCDLNWI